MGLVVNMPVQFLHDNLDFTKRYVRTTPDMDNRVKRLFKQLTAVHQRIFQCSCQSIVGTIFSLSVSKTKECASIPISQYGANIIETNMQQTRPLKNGSHRTDALRNRQICGRECFMYSHAWEAHLRHPVIFKTNDRSGN